MPDSGLDLLRQEAVTRRLKGMAGKRVHWTSEQEAFVRDFIWSAPAKAFQESSPERKLLETGREMDGLRAKLIADGTIDAADAVSPIQSRKWVARITDETVDLEQDVVKADGLRFDGFMKNSPVLLAHDSQALPVAKSTMPWRIMNSWLAIATFPDPGVSCESDRVASMAAAGMVRGVSIGFIPIKFKMSNDPSRPLGIDFLETRLLEWSFCSIPCNPNCLILGQASNKSATPPAKSVGAQAREQRMAEAASLRRIAYQP